LILLAATVDQYLIPIITVGLYLGLLLVFGWLGHVYSKANSEEDYYLAGRGQGWLISSMTIMATFFSSFALLGAPGMVYREGVVFALVSLNVPVAGFCVYLLGNRIRQAGHRGNYVTQADMLCEHYNSPILLRLLITLVGFLFAIPYIMMQLKAGGDLAAVLFSDFPNAFEVGAVVLSIITALYIMIGGMRSVAWTDALQCLLLTSGMVLAGVALVSQMGGPGQFLKRVESLPDSSLTVPGNTGFWQIPMLFSICVLMPIGGIIQPAQWMRFYSARNAQALRRSALLFIVVLTGCYVFAIMPVGLGGQVLYPLQLGENGVAPNAAVGTYDQILVVLLQETLPSLFGPQLGLIVSSLMVVAIMAAAMSTADSNLHAFSGIVTRDLYVKLLRPNSSEAERLNVGRIVIIAATGISLVFVLLGSTPDSPFAGFMEMIVGLALFAVAFSVQLLPMTLDVLFFRRGSKWGAILGLTVGLAIAFSMTTLFQPFIITLSDADAQVLRWVKHAKAAIPVHASAWGLTANSLVFIALARWRKRSL